MVKISLKFYTVKMPDGEDYYISGKSKKQVAHDYGVAIAQVSIGADTLHLLHITKYNDRMNTVKFEKGQDILDKKGITGITYDEIHELMTRVTVVKIEDTTTTWQYKDLTIVITRSNSIIPDIIRVYQNDTCLWVWKSTYDWHDKDYFIVWQSELCIFLKEYTKQYNDRMKLKITGMKGI